MLLITLSTENEENVTTYFKEKYKTCRNQPLLFNYFTHNKNEIKGSRKKKSENKRN